MSLVHIVYVCQKNRQVFSAPMRALREIKRNFVLHERSKLDHQMLKHSRWRSIFVVVFGHLETKHGEELRQLRKGDARLRGVILVEHGASHLKHFVSRERRSELVDLVLVCSRAQKLIHAALWPKLSVQRTGLGYSDTLLNPMLTREEACDRYSLDPTQPIVLVAPTWKNNADWADFFNDLLPQVASVPNHVLSCHVSNRRNVMHEGINVAHQGDQPLSSTAYLLPHADVVISDTSSVMFEFLHLKRPIIQLLWRSYPDNPAGPWELPQALPDNSPFQIGHLYSLGRDTRRLCDVVDDVLKAPPMQSNLANLRCVFPNADQAIARAIVGFVNRRLPKVGHRRIGRNGRNAR